MRSEREILTLVYGILRSYYGHELPDKAMQILWSFFFVLDIPVPASVDEGLSSVFERVLVDLRQENLSDQFYDDLFQELNNSSIAFIGEENNATT